MSELLSQLSKLPAAVLKDAIAIKKQIEQLEGKLEQLAEAAAPGVVAEVSKVLGRKKRRMSPAARAKIAAAARARWAKFRSGIGVGTPVARKTPKKKRTMSASAKARISAAAKARWAKFRAQKGKSAPVALKTSQKKKRTLSAAAKRKISAAAKARWAKAKAAGKNRL